MLDLALKFLAEQLDGYLLARTGSDFGGVQLGRFVDDGGKWSLPDDHLGLTLINLEEESTFREQVPSTALVNGRQVALEPELKVNLSILFAAHFQKYDVALRYLAHVLTFFQAHRTFTHEQYPSLDDRIERLNVELQSLGLEQLNQMWAFVGGRQIPSVVYRVRLVVLQDVEPSAIRPPLTRIQAEIHGR